MTTVTDQVRLMVRSCGSFHPQHQAQDYALAVRSRSLQESLDSLCWWAFSAGSVLVTFLVGGDLR